MSETFDQQELVELAFAVCDGAATNSQIARLEEILTADLNALLLYLQCVELHLYMAQQASAAADRNPESECPPSVSEPAAEISAWSRAVPEQSSPATSKPYDLPAEIYEAADMQKACDPRRIVLEPSPPKVIPWYSIHSPIGLHLIAHSISAILLLIGLGIASVVYVNHNYEIAASKTALSEEKSGSGSGLAGALASAEKAKPKKQEEAPVVGYISGMIGCRWADPSLKPIAPRVRQGTKFALKSGLMEITYTTGAKVILQGPCTYEVESPHGGYLALGKLTARVARGQGLAASAKSQANLKSAISKSPNLQISKFAIRTPTALITDLGTEFGVEVDKDRNTISHVFLGRVEVRCTGDVSGEAGRVIILDANQSARVERSGAGGPRGIIHLSSDGAKPSGFVRAMPRWVPIKVFNTGIGLKEGDEDPHWQIVAFSDSPNFQPQQAVVTSVTSQFLSNNPARSQWISTNGTLPKLPGGTYTFHTVFELKDVALESVLLQGRIIADNGVKRILLNNVEVSSVEGSFLPPFFKFNSFTIRKGFVEGTNVLEIEVINHCSSDKSGTPMALLVELEGVALSEWRKPAETPPAGSSPSEDKKEVRQTIDKP